jgi:hypothetical protein
MTLLEQFIQQYRNKPFSWGQLDCCLFAANWIAMNSDDDMAASFRGRYKTALGAKRLLAKNGFKNVNAVAQAYLGESIAPLLLLRGDIALVSPPRSEPALGIVAGHGVWVMTYEGVMLVPMRLVTNGWRLPCRQ